jgi:MFS family permease
VTEASGRSNATVVLAALAAGQFVMALDSSVMNVSIPVVAEDVGTDVTGIQTAITMYTLVMASLMITGGKVGAMIGRKRAFVIGCFIYAAGSLTTALSQSLGMLLFGWSLLEGLGAVLILPAIVALVASNFAREERPRAYGLLSAAMAIAIAAGPLIGGICTTYFSWRWVFVGEVVVIAGILAFSKRIEDTPPEEGVTLDYVGTVLSAVGLGLFVFGLLRSGPWGFILAKSGAAEWLGLSPAFWLMLAGGVFVWAFFGWEQRVIDRGREPLVDPALLRVVHLRAGLLAFFFQFLLLLGLFFLMSLYLTVALGLTAIATGVRLMPMSLMLLAAAVGVPKLLPHASPRRVTRVGFVCIAVGLVLLVALLDVGSGPEIVTWPLMLAGFGAGALASQLGAVTVGSVADERSGEVGGLQNTATNLGSSIATALAGAVLVSALTSSFFTGIESNPDVPASVTENAEVELSAGVPFVSDADLETALDDAGVPPDTADAILDENTAARVRALQASFGLLALFSVAALLFTGKIPATQAATKTAEPQRPPSVDEPVPDG